MRAVTLILAVSLLTPFASVQAQQLARRGLLAPGAGVRLYTSQTADGQYGRFVGRIVGWLPDSLVLRTGDDLPLVVPVASITRLEVIRGRKSKAETGAIIGGLLLGGTVLIGITMTPSCPPDKWCLGPSAADAALILTPIAVIVGAGIGALIGSGIHGDRWEEVPLDRLRVSFAPQRDGRFGLGLSVRF